ncbi:MAG: hypothetical protein GX625_17775 [Clostridiaceae bacterium]|jgi:hypothetical protein|nr:hypothetical protein [Clostridiaceae bacterium]NLZ89275.1 hypothetical protein [Clostridiales bacterium]
METMTARLRVLLAGQEGVEDALLAEMLLAAEDTILAYTGLDAMPDRLRGAQVSLAAVFFNRLGMEGETSRREGSLTISVAGLPEDIRCRLNAFRHARAVAL